MEDTALKNALKRLREISSVAASLDMRIVALRQEKEHIEKFIDEWHRFASLGRDTILPMMPETAPIGELPDVSMAVEARKRRTVGNPKKEEVAEISREIIKELGHPVTRSSLFSALEARGIKLRGSDPEMVLSTMLWRMRDRIVRVKGGGYWLAEVPYPDAGYEPGVDHTGFDSLLNKPVDEVREPHPDDIELLDRIANDFEGGDE